MVDFKYISPRGDILPLVGGENYKLIHIDKQTSISTNLSSVTVGGTDGDTVNNAQAQPRTIVLDIEIISDIEETKRKILNIVKIKQRGTLRWKQNNRELEIKGIVEDIDMPRWTKDVIMQITLHCEQPFWENVDYVVSRISEAIDLHYFTDMPNNMLYFVDEGIAFGIYDTTRTKNFYNDGDVDVGLEIEIVALKSVVNPIIYDTDNNFFGCGDGAGARMVNMSAGDVIKINTNKNHKSVTLNSVSILNKIKPSSTWLQLKAGDNQFSINSDNPSVTDDMTFSLIYKQRYI